jgi:hypothetical protein
LPKGAGSGGLASDLRLECNIARSELDVAASGEDDGFQNF